MPESLSKFLKTPFLQNTSGRLLLNIIGTGQGFSQILSEVQNSNRKKIRMYQRFHYKDKTLEILIASWS